MKQFACGEIVPGCTEQYRLATEEEILAAVGRHARDAHGLDPVPDELLAQVRAHIRPVDG
jgi:predicted small metal-binding protein